MVFASDPVKTLYLETFAEKFDSQNKFYINIIIEVSRLENIS